MSHGTQLLGAIDLFHLRTHHEMLRQGLRGNSCALVVELSGRVPETLLRERLRVAVQEMPELRWRLARDSRLRYCWKTSPGLGAASLQLQHMGDERGLLPRALQLVDTPIDGETPWSLRLLRGPKRDALVLRWFHPLCDALGAHRLLRWLCSEAPPPPVEKRWMSADRLLKNADRDALIAQARSYTAHVMELGKTPTLSLYGVRGRRRVGNMAVRRLQLSEQETAHFDASLRARAKLADTSLIIWAVARMTDRLLGARGFTPAQLLLPLPVSLDPKRGAKRMFGNHLTMMMMALGREQLRDEAAAVASLAAQRREVIRKKYDVAILAGLRLAWPLPSGLFSWLMRRPFGGERSSLVVSNPGVVGIDELFGVPVRDAYTLPAALASPGFQVIASRHNKRLSLMMVYLDGLLDRAELEGQLERLRADLLGR